MKVTHIGCGIPANESEILAVKHLKAMLQSHPLKDECFLLSNLALSVNGKLQSDDIDILVFSPTGVFVVEVKHWDAKWISSHEHIILNEADKLSMKARKVGTTLRKIEPNLHFVEGRFLLTKKSQGMQLQPGKKIRGCTIHTLDEWKTLLNVDSHPIYNVNILHSMLQIIEPRTKMAIDGEIHRFMDISELTLVSPSTDRFRRVYTGRHVIRQDRVVLTLYDFSAYDGKNALEVARREFDALQRVQQYTWAPRVLDSFQEAHGYLGEMCFFTLVDPTAPNIKIRSADPEWTTHQKIDFTAKTIFALIQMHSVFGEVGIVHRNISPCTILVRHDNTPLFTGFSLAKLPSLETVASSPLLSGDWQSTVAPEGKKGGLGLLDNRSDIYSLCASLRILFVDTNTETSQNVLNILDKGIKLDPLSRSALTELHKAFEAIIDTTEQTQNILSCQHWAEGYDVLFNDRTYRIVCRLGRGGIGTTFKVVQVDRSTGEDLGTFVGKSAHNFDTGDKARQSYAKARAIVGRHPNLSVIYETARSYQDYSFIALMGWIEGTPLSDFIGVFELLAEDFSEPIPENLAIKWINNILLGLNRFHQKGYIHGDVSPRNIILSEGDVVLTDYDFVTPINSVCLGQGTPIYSSLNIINSESATASDDIYALASSFFHVVYGKEPFNFNGNIDRHKGLNWSNIDKEIYPKLAAFLDKATNPIIQDRFSNATDAIAAIENYKLSQFTISPVQKIPVSPENLPNGSIQWLNSLLQSYPSSHMGNIETRGLDSQFARNTYVETSLEDSIVNAVITRKSSLVVLCGNAGDGKTALLQHICEKFGIAVHNSADRLIEHRTNDGLLIRVNLDGSASYNGKGADDILFETFHECEQHLEQRNIANLLAINDGKLLEWIGEAIVSTDESIVSVAHKLDDLLHNRNNQKDYNIYFVNLTKRSLVGKIDTQTRAINTQFLDSLIDKLYGGKDANKIWAPCITCISRDYCKVYLAQQFFLPLSCQSSISDTARKYARQSLYAALQAVHQRGEAHITTRELRGSLTYILFGVNTCQDYYEGTATEALPYWDLAFDAHSPQRQGEVMRELSLLDPGTESLPDIDRMIKLKTTFNTTIDIQSERRRAYFERFWIETTISSNNTIKVNLFRGKHHNIFRDIPLMSDKDKNDVCKKLCAGISRLEDLPALAYSQSDIVPLKVTPKTPTETAFWIQKPISNFFLEVENPPSNSSLDFLHRDVFIVYRYRSNYDERLRLGLDLFSLLMDLSEGYQAGDTASDDAFAQLSIFVQRLAQENETELLAWNPVQDDKIYRINTILNNGIQSICLSPTNI